MPRFIRGAPWSSIEDWACLTGRKVSPSPVPLFTKIEDSTIEALQKRFAGETA